MMKSVDSKGSILIWTVTLGLALTSVFIFMAVRLGQLGAAQRDTMEYKAAKAYLESFAAYLKESYITQPIPLALDYSAENPPFEIPSNLVLSLTQEVDAITGFVDSGDSREYTINEEVNVEYNSCNEAVVEEAGEITTNPSGTANAGYCALSQEYDNRITITPTGTLTITSVGAPTHFRIRPTTEGNKLTDNLWHLDAAMELNNGRTLEVSEEF